MAADALESGLGYLEHLPSGSLVIIKDTLHASGSFLVHHFLNRLLTNKSGGHRSGVYPHVQASVSGGHTLKDGQSSGCKVCLIGCNDTLSHFVNVGRKLGGNLTSAAEEGKLQFIDGVSKPFEFEDGRQAASKAESQTSLASVRHHTLAEGNNQRASEETVQGNLRESFGHGLRNSLANPSLSSLSNTVPYIDSSASDGSAALPAPPTPRESLGLHSNGSEKVPTSIPKPASRSNAYPSSSSQQPQFLAVKTQKQSMSNETSKACSWTCHIPSPEVFPKPSPIQSLYQLIAKASGVGTEQESRGQTSDSGVAVVFDDLGGVEAACQGASKGVLALLNGCRRLRTSNGERASVVALVHDDHVAEGKKGLTAILEHAADLVLQVEPLSTGAAADIHGQLTVTHRTDRWRLGIGSETTTGRSAGFPAAQRFQFRLLETGVKLIHIGR